MTSETGQIVNPIKTNKLNTFSIGGKTAIARIISETVSLRESNDMFNCLLIIRKIIDIALEELLSSIYVKSKLMHELEKDVNPLAQIPVCSALIVDGMTFIHQIHTLSSTFSQLADRRLQDLIHMAI